MLDGFVKFKTSFYVYIIETTCGKRYVGSSSNIDTRLANHHIKDNYEVTNIWIKEYDCVDRTHLFAYEQLVINKLKPELNQQFAFPIPLKPPKKIIEKPLNPLWCPVCEKEGKKPYYTLEHQKLKGHQKAMGAIPVKQAGFPCTFEGCDRTFTCRSKLETHLKSHSRKPAGFYCNVEGCPRMTKGFSKRSDLNKHMNTHNK
jgi:hypothetical protein